MKIQTSKLIPVLAGMLFTSCITSKPGLNQVPANSTPESFHVTLARQGQSQKIKLTVRKSVGQRIRIKFYLPDGTLAESFYPEQKAGTVIRVYNFMNAEEGNYSIVVEGKGQVINKSVKLKNLPQPEPEILITDSE
jgi:hypothetical protein